MPIGSTRSVLAARVCVPSLLVRQLLLVWSSGLCVSQVGGRGHVGCRPLILIEAPSSTYHRGMLDVGNGHDEEEETSCDFTPNSPKRIAALISLRAACT